METQMDFVNRIETKSEPLESAVRSIIDRHTSDLSIIIHKIRDMLRDDTDVLSDDEIDDILLQLPLVLYDITDELSTLVEQLDVRIYDRSYKTIKQKISMAIETLNAVKKVRDNRMQKQNLSRF